MGEETNTTNLDGLLKQCGDFGKYQKFVLFAILIVITLDSLRFSYVFTAGDLNYRCKVPQCDSNSSDIDFEPNWLINAVPYENNHPTRCERYDPLHPEAMGQCLASDFSNKVEACDYGYVYEDDEVTIVNDFDLHCDENTWKLTMVGTINNIGQFVGLPITGLFSDKLGRRSVLVWGMVLCGISGIIRAFSVNYLMFLIFEFLDAAAGAGTYACGFILGVELVGPSKRVLSGTIVSSCYAVGEVLIALLAWWLKEWRTIILASYIPPLFLISYLWLTPESVRWLLSQGRQEEAKAIIRKAAKVNKATISEETLSKISSLQEDQLKQESLVKVFQSSKLFLRFINCCFCWITCAFLFYGLTLNSVTLAGNNYVDFILTSIVEIPAYIVTCLVVDRIGRRLSQCSSFLITGISCLVFIFADEDNYYLQLFVYLFGKFGATCAFTVIYIITSEVFPTPLRHSMMGACSMIGRIGSMVSPQMPLLGQIWKPLPLLLFGIMSTIAGLLSMMFPETLNTKLPDTIEEAENVGQKSKKLSC